MMPDAYRVLKAYQRALDDHDGDVYAAGWDLALGGWAYPDLDRLTELLGKGPDDPLRAGFADARYHHDDEAKEA